MEDSTTTSRISEENPNYPIIGFIALLYFYKRRSIHSQDEPCAFSLNRDNSSDLSTLGKGCNWSSLVYPRKPPPREPREQTRPTCKDGENTSSSNFSKAIPVKEGITAKRRRVSGYLQGLP
ncbi:hypothetical protein ILUMI_26257, partial [Ignelater luminosus]